MTRKWYALATAIKPVPNKAIYALAAWLNVKVSKQVLCTLRKVGKFPRELGELLDDVNAPLSIVRFIAHAKSPAERDERARLSIAALLDKREGGTRPDRLAKTIAQPFLRRAA